MIEDELKILDVEEIKSLTKTSKEDVVKILLDKETEIKNTFHNNEYIKFDLTHGKIIGLKSTAKFVGMEIGDLPALDYVIRQRKEYNGAEIINLGNVNMLYEKYQELQ